MDTRQIETIVQGAIAGASTRAIGADIGMHHSVVAKKLHDPAIRARIETMQLRAIEEHADIVFSNMDHAIRAYQAASKPVSIMDKAGRITTTMEYDEQLREHGFKYGMALMQGIGILPSHAPSVFIQQINQSNTVNIDAHVQALSHGFHLTPQDDSEIVDCDYDVDDGV